MPITVLETINWPGCGLTDKDKKITGDDRFGFDESASTAWVLDGATDLGPYRLFDREESDAAWIAEEYNRAFMLRNPANYDTVSDYFRDSIASVQKLAKKASRIDLNNAEKSTLPIASGMWVWAQDDQVILVRLGDCIAVTHTPDGQIEVFENRTSADLESETSQKLNAMSPEDKLQGLRDIRAIQNTESQHILFGLLSEAVNNLVIETRDLPDGTHILIMSDGLWRLVDVYKLMTAEELITSAIDTGVESLAKQLRAFEAEQNKTDAVRVKKSDDACGVLIEL